MTPEQCALRAQIGARSLHAQGKTTTEAARAAAERGIARAAGIPDDLKETDPDEYDRRFAHAKTAHYSKLALKSSIARSKAKRLAAEAEAAEAELDALGGQAC